MIQKKSRHYGMIRFIRAGKPLWLAWALTLGLQGCEDRIYDNPLDPQSGNYAGDSYAADENNNNIADFLEPLMVEIPQGCYERGSGLRRCLSPFLMQETEVTVTQYWMVTAGQIPHWGIDSLPVSSVSWIDAARFCNKLSGIHGYDRVYQLSGSSVAVQAENNGYRLPTEAEWEYAYAADSAAGYYWEGGDSLAAGYAWYRDNAGDTLHKVKQKRPNNRGLYDMSGNVLEWTQDWYADSLSGGDNPSGPDSGLQRVAKGGACNYPPVDLKRESRQKLRPVAARPFLGFRLARSPGK